MPSDVVIFAALFRLLFGARIDVLIRLVLGILRSAFGGRSSGLIPLIYRVIRCLAWTHIAQGVLLKCVSTLV